MKRVYRKSITDLYQQEKLDVTVPVDGEIERGSQVYMVNCAGCHSLEIGSGSSHSKGPALGLIYNRKVGSDKDYESYSEAMINSNNYQIAVSFIAFSS